MSSKPDVHPHFMFCHPIVMEGQDAARTPGKQESVVIPNVEECCRSRLKGAVEDRRNSLTFLEIQFLEELAEMGSESHVQEAYHKILDETLFETVEGKNSEERIVQPSKAGSDCLNGDVGLDTVINNSSFRRNASDQSLHQQTSIDELKDLSLLREQLLTERRRGGACQMWRAHENGLMVSIPASRRSLLTKQASVARMTRRASSNNLRSRLMQDVTVESSQQTLKNWSKLRNVVLAKKKLRELSFTSPQEAKLILSQDDLLGCLTNHYMSVEEKKEDEIPRENESRNHLRIHSILEGINSIDEGFEICRALSDPSFTSLVDEDEVDTDFDEKEEDGRASFRRQDFGTSMRFRDHGLKLLHRPVLMRFDESLNGEGLEIADWDDARPTLERQNSHLVDGNGMSRCSNSFDETMSFLRVSKNFEQHADQNIRRSLSDDILFKHFTETQKASKGFLRHIEEYDHYDSWLVINDEKINDFGGSLQFVIIGTSAHDNACHPHVLSPPLMESLQSFLPYNKRGESMWLKYSMVRDGASMRTFLRHARSSEYTFLSIETIEGEVFGSFTARSWRKNWNTFGVGAESFLWRMQGSRSEKCWSIIDQAKKESEIDIYPFFGGDSKVQLCTSERIVVGGTGKAPVNLQTLRDGTIVEDYNWGFGLMIEEDLIRGTSSPCTAFRSPPLSKMHNDGSLFQIMNLELWTLTPCMSQVEAEKMEFNKFFLAQHAQGIPK